VKQVFQHIRTGTTEVAEVPAPVVRPGSVLVRVVASLVSAGTERMVVEFARKSALQKARARPDLVRQVLDKAKREGVLTTWDAVTSRLDQPMALGYSVAGVVLAAGQGAPFQPGDRVACAGANQAVHADVVSVPKNLVVRVPDEVPFDEACFATLGAIALHGVRLADLRVGESAAVIGLGLLGQLTVQLLVASGVRVAGFDPKADRVDLALRLGASDATASGEGLEAIVAAMTGNRGVDAVLICADTPSDEPVDLAARVARDKGAVVAVGAVGMHLPRKPFFDKELRFCVSRSYGPGRYDPDYEERGQDYPYGFVRWTEQRNLEAVIELMAAGRLAAAPLVTHRFPIAEALKAFDMVTGRTSESFLGVVLGYPEDVDLRTRIAVADAPRAPQARIALGVIGAGLFANATMLPVIRKVPVFDRAVVTAGAGLQAVSAARRFAFRHAASTADEVLADPAIDLVAVLTRHSSHARMVTRALEAGKHVFVEKPLCVTTDELAQVIAARSAATRDGRPPMVMVGFNRRFAPMVVDAARALSEVREPLLLHYRVNAGFIPASHWTQHAGEGGRIIGEACHFIDLLVHLARRKVVRVTGRALPDSGRYQRDNVSIALDFEDGSLGLVAYLANGAKDAGKEWLEVSGGGVTVRLDDYRRLDVFGGRPMSRRSRLRQDKGHTAEWAALAAHLSAGAPEPMSFDSIVHSTRVTLAAAESVATGEPVPVVTEEGQA